MAVLTKGIINDIILWDIKSWYPILSYWKENSRLDLNNSKSLEIGAYQGGLSLWLALNGSNVTCSDIENPQKNAFILHNKYKTSGCIKYEKIDALNIPFENEFDIVVFKSVLGGIGRNNNKELQQKAIHEIFKSLRPKGELFFAENLIGSPLHRFFREKFIPWGKEWRYVSLDEMKDFLQLFRELDIEERGFWGAFGWTELVRKIFAFADQLFFNHVMISNWKYIVYGIARK